MGEYTFHQRPQGQTATRFRHRRACSSPQMASRLRQEPWEGVVKGTYGKGRASMFKRLAIVLALLVVLLAPGVVRAQSSADLIVADLDAYWSQQLAERGI